MFKKGFLIFIGAFLLATNTEAAYLYIVPDKASLSAGELSGATIYINSEGKAINNGEAVITYKASQINVESILSLLNNIEVLEFGGLEIQAFATGIFHTLVGLRKSCN